MIFINNLYYYKSELLRDIYKNYINKLYSRFNFMKIFILIKI